MKQKNAFGVIVLLALFSSVLYGLLLISLHTFWVWFICQRKQMETKLKINLTDLFFFQFFFRYCNKIYSYDLNVKYLWSPNLVTTLSFLTLNYKPELCLSAHTESWPQANSHVRSRIQNIFGFLSLKIPYMIYQF